MLKDFLGDLVVKILLSSAGGASSIPGQETKIPHSVWLGKKKKKKKKRYVEILTSNIYEYALI